MYNTLRNKMQAPWWNRIDEEIACECGVPVSSLVDCQIELREELIDIVNRWCANRPDKFPSAQAYFLFLAEGLSWFYAHAEVPRWHVEGRYDLINAAFFEWLKRHHPDLVIH